MEGVLLQLHVKKGILDRFVKHVLLDILSNIMDPDEFIINLVQMMKIDHVYPAETTIKILNILQRHK